MANNAALQGKFIPPPQCQNREEYQNVPEQSLERWGTNKDRDNLTERFQALGFEVHCHNNKKKADVLKEIRKAATANHADADSFVCIFLSHGDEGEIEACDAKIKILKIKNITDFFRGDECKSLVGKPKIFIFQACAGNKYEDAVTGMMAGYSDDEVVEEAANIYTIPAGADFLMCYSVAPGFVSFRNEIHGGLYIQDLCTTLQQHGSTIEFTELLTLVNLKVSQHTANGDGFKNEKQMPCFTSLLTKRLYFRPKNL
ncbi:caspase-6-like [Silurus meridionalis]|uniref:caspase-6-like n=1 Tax=Silurus meridionalis TaxID=175797 RepID=UPI001EEBC223|nr:caspase-6-like [Silurus meridionalis]